VRRPAAVLAAVRPAVRERRLRRTVRRLRACLDGLPSLERRVLVLRSGLGRLEPRSRARVARRLDLATRRVARLERRGLRRLRGLARAGCDSHPPAPQSAPAGPSTVIATGAAAARLTFGGGEAGRGAVKGAQESGSGGRDRGGRGGRKPAFATEEPEPGQEPPAAVVRPPADNATDYTLPLLIALALLGGAFALRELWRARHD
jgi:hypothetical protein